MYLGSWKIDDYLTFPCNCHNASTGAASDADSAPSYRIYEDETGTPLLTGSFAILDDSNTTGFYTERVQLTAANGFEKGKTYTIYMEATVSSVKGTGSHTFQIEAEVNTATVQGLMNTIDGILDDLHDTDIPAIKTVVDANGVKLTSIQGKTDMFPVIWYSA